MVQRTCLQNHRSQSEFSAPAGILHIRHDTDESQNDGQLAAQAENAALDGKLSAPSTLLVWCSQYSSVSTLLIALICGIACSAILALKKVPHWEHPDDISFIRSTLRGDQVWDDVSIISLADE